MNDRPPRDPSIGPLGAWELVRLARRGQATRSRLIVLGFVFAAAVLMPAIDFSIGPIELFAGQQFPISIAERANFAVRQDIAILTAVLLAVYVMTPAYAASAIAEEKERGTLQLLQTTLLSDHEIVYGKAVGRFGFVAAAILSAVPALVMTTLYGGVDLWLIAAGGAVIASTAWLMIAIGTMAACYSSGVREAWLRAYATCALAATFMLVPPFFWFHPLVILVTYEPSVAGRSAMIATAVCTLVFQFIVARRLMKLSIVQFRLADSHLYWTPDQRRPNSAPVDQSDDAANGLKDAIRRPPFDSFGDSKRFTRSLPPVNATNPLLWKERYIAGRVGIGIVGYVFYILFGAICLNCMFLGWDALVLPAENLRIPSSRIGNAAVLVGGWYVLMGAVVAAAVYLFPVALRLPAAVLGERRRQTLDGLLALPISRTAILWSKMRGVMERGWPWAAIALIANAEAFGVVGGPVLGLAAATSLAAGFCCVAALGALVTVCCPSEVRGLRLLMPLVILVASMPLVVWNCTGDAADGGRFEFFLIDAGGLAIAAVIAWCVARQQFCRVE